MNTFNLKYFTEIELKTKPKNKTKLLLQST